ncbi:MAG: alpha-amylase family glycosyl hydrolase [Myxococcota bacterium]
MKTPRTIALTFAAALVACGDDSSGNGTAGNGSGGNGVCGQAEPTGGTLVDVSGVFEPCDAVVDAVSGTTYTVSATGQVGVDAGSEDLVLLEAQDTTAADFAWDNASVYFVMTDRFENGNPANDNSYGRQVSPNSPDFGSWHGGDFAGLTSRLDYVAALGMDAIWISPPVEQIHGWVGGGSMGDFQHFAYHGYWAVDFTKLDANFGTEDELRTLVREAHARGIRVIFDVVLNHPGYASIADLVDSLPEVLNPTHTRWLEPDVALAPGENWHSFNDAIQFGSNVNWINWWGPEWVRVADFPGHDDPGSDELTSQLASLPDFKTESEDFVGLPPVLTVKDDTRAEALSDATVRDYLVAWHTDWIRRFGIDGFRCDTAKHVELETWTALKTAGTEALAAWRAENPNDPLVGDTDFWMTGEAFPPVRDRDAYFPAGFDSLINFDFNRDAEDLIEDFDELETYFADLDALVNDDPDRNELTYASSHDTELFFGETGGDFEAQALMGTALMLSPGAVQVFYGEESGRAPGPDSSDGENPTRSDMNWDEHSQPENASLIDHWRTLGQFRKRHRSVGAGTHTRIQVGAGAYAFSRTLGDDGVVVVMFE